MSYDTATARGALVSPPYLEGGAKVPAAPTTLRDIAADIAGRLDTAVNRLDGISYLILGSPSEDRSDMPVSDGTLNASLSLAQAYLEQLTRRLDMIESRL